MTINRLWILQQLPFVDYPAKRVFRLGNSDTLFSELPFLATYEATEMRYVAFI